MEQFVIYPRLPSPVTAEMPEISKLTQLVRKHRVLVLRDQLLDAQGLRDLAQQLGAPIAPTQLPHPPAWVLDALSDPRRGLAASITAAFLAKGSNEWGLLLDGVTIEQAGVPMAFIDRIYIGTKSGVSHDYNPVDQIDIIQSQGGDSLEACDIWHSDASYLPIPPSLGVFYACVTPEDMSGQTLFCDMVAVLESLSPKLRGWLLDCRASHAAASHAKKYGAQGGRLISLPAIPAPIEHPMVLRRSEGAAPCLYVNPFYTSEIVGLDRNESEDMLQMIFSRCARPEFIYSHAWREGDLVLYDNHATLHYAVKNVRSIANRKILRALISAVAI